VRLAFLPTFPMKTPMPLLPALLLLAAALPFAHALDAAEKPAPEQLDFFEKKIRPILSEHCYKCHSEKSEKVRGGLLLDTREGIRRGGDNGPAVVPGDLKESLLIEAIQHTNKDFAMPPEKDGPKLGDAVIKDFEAWVKMGAPDPRDGAAKVVAKYDDAAARKWWSFQPVQKAAAPTPKNTTWAKTDIDKFLLAGLEARGLQPVADADRATLLRRVYFDLVGLPPTPRELDTFLKDPSPKAFENVVDRLLALPQFGERWGRHWLDVARYAESTGRDVNIAFPHAWRYRDYVIGAFNADKPYNQFIKEQIAGDLLAARDDKDKAEKLVATSFLAIGPKSLNERNPKQFAMDVADEQIDTMSQAILGLTISCARCHDHKFDPIPQRDYYALAGIFLSTETRYGTIPGIQNGNPTSLIELPAKAGFATPKEPLSSEARAKLESDVADARKQREEMVGEGLRVRAAEQSGKPDTGNSATRFIQIQAAVARAAFLETELNSFDEAGEPKAFCMGVQDKPTRDTVSRQYAGAMRGGAQGMRAALAERFKSGQPFRRPSGFEAISDSPLFARGEVEKPGDRVPRGFPAVLTPSTPPSISGKSSGRHELAEWLVAPQNPLAARVMVNRVWHWLFGRGLVESVDNFGTTGQKPSNPALLDYLANDFMSGGWSVKRLIKDIVLSRGYQLASAYDEKSFTADPENTLVWRMSKRRLDAECVRDAMLAASGQLDLNPPVASVIGRAGDSAIGGPRGRGVGEESIIHAAGNVRSVYLPIARDVVPDALAVFDFAETSLVTGARETTNVPSQALYLLNSTFVSLQAQALADRVLKGYPGGPNGGVSASFDQRLAYAYWLAFARGPDAVERKAAADFFGKFPSNWKKGDTTPLGMRDADNVKAAWTSFCRALFASAEFRYLN
jgi:hypothetical protein